jgi:hypothetical protein
VNLMKDGRSSKGKPFPAIGVVLETFRHRAGGGLRFRVAVTHRGIYFVIKDLLRYNHVARYEGLRSPSACGLENAVALWGSRGFGSATKFLSYSYEALYVVFKDFSPGALRDRRVFCACVDGTGCKVALLPGNTSTCKCVKAGLVCCSKCHVGTKCMVTEYKKHGLKDTNLANHQKPAPAGFHPSVSSAPGNVFLHHTSCFILYLPSLAFLPHLSPLPPYLTSLPHLPPLPPSPHTPVSQSHS